MKVRVSHTHFCGRELLEVREWFEADRSVLRPTRKGAVLPWDKVADSASGLGKVGKPQRSDRGQN